MLNLFQHPFLGLAPELSKERRKAA